MAAFLCERGAVAGERGSTGVSLSWTRLPGAETCTSARELARRVDQQLDQPIFAGPEGATLLIEGWVEHTAQGWRAVLRTVDFSGQITGTRELVTTEEACASLDRSVTLAIALMAHPLEEPKTAPTPAPPPVLGPPMEVPPRDTGVRVPENQMNPESLRSKGELGAALTVGWGVLPKPSPGLAFRGGLAPPWFLPVELSGHLWVPENVQPLGVARSSYHLRPLFAAYAGLHADVSLAGPVGLFAGGGLAVSFPSETFYATAPDGSQVDLWHVPTFIEQVELGLLVHFGS
jgi:hypothetical protein